MHLKQNFQSILPYRKMYVTLEPWSLDNSGLYVQHIIVSLRCEWVVDVLSVMNLSIMLMHFKQKFATGGGSYQFQSNLTHHKAHFAQELCSWETFLVKQIHGGSSKAQESSPSASQPSLLSVGQYFLMQQQPTSTSCE
jgi:hypothetical protein